MTVIETSGTAFCQLDAGNRTVINRPLPYADDEWKIQGDCNYHEPDLWFADPESEDGLTARAICLTCPVIRLCAEAALLRKETFGIWAGLDFNDQQTRCSKGHWITDDSLKKNGACKPCINHRQREQRQAAHEQRIAA